MATPKPIERWPQGPLRAVHQVGARVEVTWADATAASMPLVWLRDNCPCHRCRVASTGERRYFIGLVDELPSASSCMLVDGKLSIAWSDSHQSEFAPTDLASLAATAGRTHKPARLWANGFAPARFDHQVVLDEPGSRLAFYESLICDGAVVVTNAGGHAGECARFIEAIGAPVRATPFDRVHDVYCRADGYNVAHTDEALPPHTDFASYQWPPSGQVLHMLTNEVGGGASVLVDGWQVLTTLRQHHPGVIDVLARVEVAFREHSETAESWCRAPIVRLGPTGEIAGIRFSNQLMQPLDPTRPDVEAFYSAYHTLARALLDPANRVTFRMENGDMLLVHGHRILHAREAYDSRSGPRHLQDTYFEFDDIAAAAALLGREIP